MRLNIEDGGSSYVITRERGELLGVDLEDLFVSLKREIAEKRGHLPV
jgi:hypothetical protein